VVTVSPQHHRFASHVNVIYDGQTRKVDVNPQDGTWTLQASGPMPAALNVESAYRGKANYSRGNAAPPPASVPAKPKALALGSRK
jgi:hypothetical protein